MVTDGHKMTSRPTANEYRHHGDILHDALAVARRVARAAAKPAVVGIALTIGPALIGWMIQSSVPLDQLGVVVLGGLIALGACRRT
jgi:hypothetical protein